MLVTVGLFLVGFMAGALNAAGGGGTFVALPALVAAGLPPVVANASTTVALLPGALAGAWTYRGQLVRVGPTSTTTLTTASVLGGILGAALLLLLPSKSFSAAVPWLLAFATLVLAFGRTLSRLLTKSIGHPVELSARTVLIGQFATTTIGHCYPSWRPSHSAKVLRARHRVLAAMHNQATQQGRYLGGRPPYGYCLVDAGPHPNPADARWGRRLQRLAPDPRTAPHLTWMFRQRLAGHSVASIARDLNERSIPCPSSVDPDRNRHRSRGAWPLRTVAVILANPRYTGRQIWNRRASSTDGPASTPALSAKAAHPALVTEQDFVAAQQDPGSAPCQRWSASPVRPGRAHPLRCLRPTAGLTLEPRTPDL